MAGQLARHALVIGLALGAAAISPASPQEPERPHALDEGRKLVREGKLAEAEALARKRLPEVEASRGPESLEVAEVLDVLAESLWRAGRVKGPEPVVFVRRALSIKEKTLGPDHAEVATSLMILGGLLSRGSDLAAARAAYERAVSIREKALGPEHPELARSLSSLAGVLGDTGSLSDARRLFDRAVAILEKTRGPDHPDLARVLNNSAHVLADSGDNDRARSQLERALAIHEKNQGPEHPLVAGTLNNLGALLWRLGEFSSARPLYERSLSITEKLLGPEHPEVAAPLNNLALLVSDMGEYAEARALHERALAVREKGFGAEHPMVAVSLANLGVLLMETGDYAEARPLLERARTIREKALGPEHPDVATNLQALGDLLTAGGDYDEARPFFDGALALREKLFGPEHMLVAATLNSLAGLLAKTGDYEGARSRFERVLAILERSVGPEHPYVADTLNGFGKMLADAGDDAAARAAFQRAFEIREKALGAAHPDVAASLAGLAEVLSRSGERAAALSAALRAEDIGRAHLRLTARAQSERQALAYAAVRASGLGLALSIAAEGLESVSLSSVWDALVRSRAVVLDEMAARHRSVVEGDDPEVARLARELVAARQRLANLTVRGTGDDPAAHRKLLDEARSLREKAEEALAQRSASFRTAQARERQGLAEIAAALPLYAALVAFARYDAPVPSRRGAGASPDDPGPPSSYLALVLAGSNAQPVAVALGAAREIDELVALWRDEAAGGATIARRAARAEAGYRETGARLRQRVWDSIVPSVGGARRVFVVPDGSLNLVNLAALPTDEARYLVESGPLLHYLSTERDLVAPGVSKQQTGGLLALGGPAFDETSLFASLAAAPTPGASVPARAPVPAAMPVGSASFRGRRSACGDFESMRFEPLPASAREAEAVVSLWKQGRRTGARAVAEAEMLSGATASERAFKEKARGRRILHLATHGFFLAQGCAPGAESAGAPRGPGMPVENPLVLAGLALAGANRRAAANTQEDDGVLTAEEIGALDLSGVEWAVLSACDTGLGEVRAGEGVLGLRRAFQVAGAGTLIMSLWPVDDESARQWMEALYRERLLGKLATNEAVREASLSVLRERRRKGESTHPFFWAGFVAAGDWR